MPRHAPQCPACKGTGWEGGLTSAQAGSRRRRGFQGGACPVCKGRRKVEGPPKPVQLSMFPELVPDGAKAEKPRTGQERCP